MRSSSKLIRMEATRPFFDSRSPTQHRIAQRARLDRGGVDRPGAIDQRLDANSAARQSQRRRELLPIASTVLAVARL